ncbi:MAG: hypothetical protein HQL03_15500, partial [Nitrospirae bacterium]|nr:hypothetical protein [Nitrospirota bacterium]
MMLFGLLFCTAIGINSVPLLTVAGSVPLLTVAGAADSSFTQVDRDRMIRFEEALKAVNQRLDALNQRLDDNVKAINQRFDAINQRFDAVNQKIDDGLRATNQRIDDLKGVIYVLISVTMSSVLVIVGFILWDR